MKVQRIGKVLAFTSICLSLALTANFVPAEPTEAAVQVGAHSASLRTKLLWKMEFNGRAGTKPSDAVFSYDLGGGGWGNAEHQSYTDYNAVMNGTGRLRINLNRVSYDVENDIYPDCPIDTPGNACEFESARIITKDKLNFKYGRIIARIKNPAGIGTWPAFWLLGSDIETNAWPNCGEIDIMEGKGAEPFTVHGTVHGPGYSGGDGITNSRSLSRSLTSTYHTYQIDWLPNSIKWYVDGKLYHSVTPNDLGNNSWVFNKSMFMILNVAAGGWFTGQIDPDLNNAHMAVDYIRYYSINGYGILSGTSAAKKAGKP